MKPVERALQIFSSQEVIGFPKPRYIHGEIPTRADVKDLNYQRVVQEEAISGALDSLLGCFNPISLHNYLVSALRQIKGDPFDAEALYTGNSRSYFDSAGQRSPLGYIRLMVERLSIDGALDPVSITDGYLEILRECKEIVETTEQFLTGFSRPRSFITNLRYESPLPGVKEQRIEGGGQSSIFEWQYNFTPKEVFQNVAGPLEQELVKLKKEMLTGKGSSLKNIQKLWGLLDTLEKSRAGDFLASHFIGPRGKSSFSMERNPLTEAGRLFQENLRIAQGCDIFT